MFLKMAMTPADDKGLWTMIMIMTHDHDGDDLGRCENADGGGWWCVVVKRHVIFTCTAVTFPALPLPGNTV